MSNTLKLDDEEINKFYFNFSSKSTYEKKKTEFPEFNFHYNY